MGGGGIISWPRVGVTLSAIICWGFFSGQSVKTAEGTASSSLFLRVECECRVG